jgi:hypothetical protein
MCDFLWERKGQINAPCMMSVIVIVIVIVIVRDVVIPHLCQCQSQKQLTTRDIFCHMHTPFILGAQLLLSSCIGK